MSAGAVHLLQKSLADAHKDLSSTNDAIRKLTGRDPDLPPPPRPTPDRRASGGRMRAWSGDYGGPAAKRRDSAGSYSRLAGRLGPPPRGSGPERRRDSDGEEWGKEKDHGKPSLQSSVVATTAQPRPKGDEVQDEKSKKRNRRMFGFLMGTLQKFKEKEDANKQSEKERRRSEIEEKLEEAQKQEKEMAVMERRELFEQRKQQKSKLARLESQVATVAMYEEWNVHDRQMSKYIQTKAKPPIFYLPAEHTPESEQLLKESRDKIEAQVAERQKEVESFLAEEKATSLADKESIPHQEEPMNIEEGEGGVGGKGEDGEGKEEEGNSRERRMGSESGEVSESD